MGMWGAALGRCCANQVEQLSKTERAARQREHLEATTRFKPAGAEEDASCSSLPPHPGVILLGLKSSSPVPF